MEDEGLAVDNERFTLVVAVESLVGVTKIAYSMASRKTHLESQAEVMRMDGTPLLSAYRAVFPIFHLLARIEDVVLAPWLRGHMLITTGHIQK